MVHMRRGAVHTFVWVGFVHSWKPLSSLGEHGAKPPCVAHVGVPNIKLTRRNADVERRSGDNPPAWRTLAFRTSSSRGRTLMSNGDPAIGVERYQADGGISWVGQFLLPTWASGGVSPTKFCHPLGIIRHQSRDHRSTSTFFHANLACRTPSMSTERRLAPRSPRPRGVPKLRTNSTQTEVCTVPRLMCM